MHNSVREIKYVTFFAIAIKTTFFLYSHPLFTSYEFHINCGRNLCEQVNEMVFFNFYLLIRAAKAKWKK